MFIQASICRVLDATSTNGRLRPGEAGCPKPSAALRRRLLRSRKVRCLSRSPVWSSGCSRPSAATVTRTGRSSRIWLPAHRLPPTLRRPSTPRWSAMRSISTARAARWGCVAPRSQTARVCSHVAPCQPAQSPPAKSEFSFAQTLNSNELGAYHDAVRQQRGEVVWPKGVNPGNPAGVERDCRLP